MLSYFGSIVMDGDMKYVVIGIVCRTTYDSLLRILCLTPGSYHLLPWPTAGWVITILHGADAMPVKIDYILCHVPRTLKMRMKVYKACMHMIFSYLKRFNIPPTIQPSSIITCDVTDYVT